MGQSRHSDKIRRVTGFTLIEVLISLSIFGVLIGGLLGFLPWATDGVSKIKDRSVALGMVDAIQIELERLGFSIVERGTQRLEGLFSANSKISDSQLIRQLVLVAPRNGSKVSFERVVERKQSKNSKGQFVLSNSLESISEAYNSMGGLVEFDHNKELDLPVSLVGLEEGKEDAIATNAWNRWIEEDQRYFGVFCSQFARFPQGETGLESRHFHHPSNGYLALEIEVQWPYKMPGRDDPIEEKFRNRITFPLAVVR
jgi:prepilin-type N-terminal cleavage/methylation domain-containing protein